MIVWLSSYPRSGNTLTRTILNKVFMIETYSEYNDKYDLGVRKDVSLSVGHKGYEDSWYDFYSRAYEETAMNIVKTHGPPQDDSPAIYVVRDPRSAIISQFHYFKSHPLTPADFNMQQLIDGMSFGGSWSRNLDAWNPLDRPHTLFLRYEEILNKPEHVISLMSDFLGKPAVAAWHNPFESQHELLPTFFRSASDQANLAEWTAEDLHALWNRHGGWMQKLGYVNDFALTETAFGEERPLSSPPSRITSHWR
ncbi:Sulfotransferase domain-containing protein [Azospirillum oryzae]|uniref:Sulfotransferase domain-containing protein n=2 Tax=Azospirillum oryzae TaxID=286727 RepID=A0A1X7F0G7_9PROT|nr:sulfotransferase domain-containing protein [Azospirillum oryzae]SMF43097.1 Sulfotransferase domain-containing protein [Azospirillum oryzae]